MPRGNKKTSAYQTQPSPDNAEYLTRYTFAAFELDAINAFACLLNSPCEATTVASELDIADLDAPRQAKAKTEAAILFTLAVDQITAEYTPRQACCVWQVEALARRLGLTQGLRELERMNIVSAGEEGSHTLNATTPVELALGLSLIIAGRQFLKASNHAFETSIAESLETLFAWWSEALHGCHWPP